MNVEETKNLLIKRMKEKGYSDDFIAKTIIEQDINAELNTMSDLNLLGSSPKLKMIRNKYIKLGLPQDKIDDVVREIAFPEAHVRLTLLKKRVKFHKGGRIKLTNKKIKPKGRGHWERRLDHSKAATKGKMKRWNHSH
jgi:hypothetical protein